MFFLYISTLNSTFINKIEALFDYYNCLRIRVFQKKMFVKSVNTYVEFRFSSTQYNGALHHRHI